MATTAARQSDYISEARTAVRQLWQAINTLKSLQREWTAEDYGNTLADGVNANLGINRAAVGAAVFATADAIVTVLDTGHATNLANLL